MNAILRDLRMESESGRMQNFLRMSDADFQFLLDQISPSIKKQDTHLRRAITPVERFTITLRFLATGENFDHLSYTARVSPHAISYIVMDVCSAIIKVLADQIQVNNKKVETVLSMQYILCIPHDNFTYYCVICQN